MTAAGEKKETTREAHRKFMAARPIYGMVARHLKQEAGLFFGQREKGKGAEGEEEGSGFYICVYKSRKPRQQIDMRRAVSGKEGNEEKKRQQQRRRRSGAPGNIVPPTINHALNSR